MFPINFDSFGVYSLFHGAAVVGSTAREKLRGNHLHAPTICCHTDYVVSPERARLKGGSRWKLGAIKEWVGEAGRMDTVACQLFLQSEVTCQLFVQSEVRRFWEVFHECILILSSALHFLDLQKIYSRSWSGHNHETSMPSSVSLF